jgi:histidinol-phosphate/aromatic aminotransferase/cobyric acid decarboxylase-like protein/choline kinase
MQALILAAGYGRRMQPLTQTTHKTLLPIGDRTVIERIIDALLAYNITDIAIVTGYLADDLKAFLARTYPQMAITYIHNDRYAQTNNIYSLALALENLPLTSDMVLIESDLIFEPAVLGRLLACQHPNVALVDHYRSGMDGTVVTVDDGMVTSVIPSYLQGADFDFHNKYKTLNIYRFSQAFCTTVFKRLLTYYARVIDDNCYYELILGILIYMQREVIHAVVLQGEKWAEIDDPNDLDDAHFRFVEAQRLRVLESSFGGFWHYDVLDFCYLRNMYFPTGAVLSELRNNMQVLVQNYGSAQHIVNRKLAYYLLCDAAHVTALNGASQFYPFLQRAFTGKHVLMPAPSFGEYARIFPQARTYRDEVGLHTTEILEQAQTCDLVVVVNPNNPTGSTLPTSWLYDFAATHPHTTLLVDESFIEFSQERSLLPLLEQAPLANVVLLTSLSKTLGVPGLRLGYVYSTTSAWHMTLREALPIWNLNSLAEYFLEIILKHRPAIDLSWQYTIRDREQLAAQLARLPLVERVYPSGGNFLLTALRCNRSTCQQLVDTLLRHDGIYVKDVSTRFHGQQSYLRLAVRLPTEHTRFLACWRRLTADWG